MSVLLLFVTSAVFADEVAASVDMAKLPLQIRPYVRYLTLKSFDDKERLDAFKVVAGHCQHLSTRSSIVLPAYLSPTLMRVNLLDYGWSTETWEQLFDPYHSVTLETTTETPWHGGVWPKDGRWYAANSFIVVKTVKTQATAPWLDVKAMLALVAGTQSKAPIVRADWFFNQTAVSQGRKPGYYDFLGVKNEKDFQKLGAFDKDLIRAYSREVRETVSLSGVTLQPRAIGRDESPGPYWWSLDFKRAVDKQNPLRNLGSDIDGQEDASEQYIMLPNGFWATGLFNKQKLRQDTAPGDIANDGFSKSNDKQVHVNVSCVRCHTKGGLQDIDGWVRGNLKAGQVLQSPDYQRYVELREQYQRKLEPFMARDRLRYADAVKECTGWSTEEYAKRYSAFWEKYEDARVDLAWAARDWGMKEVEFREKLLGYQKRTGQLDPVLAGLVRGGVVSMRQHEENMPLYYQVLGAK